MSATDPDLTRLLRAWSDGDDEALDQLFPMVFDDLHRMARYFFQRESGTHTLQPTALVSELYPRFRGQKTVEFDGREDFFNFAAEVMRHFLVDYARKRKAEKRGGNAEELPVDEGILHQLSTVPTGAGLLDLNIALEELESIDSRQAQIVQLRFFLGLQVKEIAELLGVSDSTVKRDWRTARFWLRRHLKGSSQGG